MEAQQLKFEGIERAIDNANDKASQVVQGRLMPWSDIAYNFLLNFLRENKGSAFMVENVRSKAVGIIPEPPSKRAWGGIVVKAKNNGLIRHIGYRQVKNPKAHMANASLWAVN
ncbi:MAG: hypothetical protein CMD31_00140 [Flavobacteriales bacterium]|nr:hypothetical protein [Flavobacteriales bacterium]|tara:strand:- start:336 stop:674 length:339 start_codon:yes stop_codon:yes gene_type:complete